MAASGELVPCVDLLKEENKYLRIQIITSDSPNAWETNLIGFDGYRNLAG